MTSATRNENRLSEADRLDARHYMQAKVKLWQRQERTPGDASELVHDTLRQVIGCDERDMRPSELAELREMAEAALARGRAHELARILGEPISVYEGRFDGRRIFLCLPDREMTGEDRERIVHTTGAER